MIGALRDRGVDDNLVRAVSQRLGPDSSGIFLLVRDVEAAQVLEELRPFKASVVHTTLTPQQEQVLSNTLAEEHLAPGPADPAQ